MGKVLLDTDVVIDFLRAKTELFLQLLESQRRKEVELYLSSITLMELFAGEMNTRELTEVTELLETFTVISFDKQLAKFAGKLKRGKRLNAHFADFIIGATSIYLNAKLATRNKNHFQGIGKIRFY